MKDNNNNNMVLVIQERDLDDQERSVIGVATSIVEAEDLIDEYYRDYREISFRDIRDSNLEYSKVIELDYLTVSEKTYRCEITLKWFELNIV